LLTEEDNEKTKPWFQFRISDLPVKSSPPDPEASLHPPLTWPPKPVMAQFYVGRFKTTTFNSSRRLLGHSWSFFTRRVLLFLKQIALDPTSQRVTTKLPPSSPITTPSCTHTARYFFLHFYDQTKSWFHCELLDSRIRILFCYFWCCWCTTNHDLIVQKVLLQNKIIISPCEILWLSCTCWSYFCNTIMF